MGDPIDSKLVPIENLHFDPDNPRLPTSVDGKKEPQVLEWMLEDATIPELMGAIGEQGYFPGEPLLVVPADGKKNGAYTVVEGNRRLAAIKFLNNPNLAPLRRKRSIQNVYDETKHRPKELPVIVFSQRDDILSYLGYRHVTGIKQWDPLAKARYLKQLAKKTKGSDSKKKFQDLARTIGSHWDYVAKLLTGLAIYKMMERNQFFEIAGLDENSIDFSLLTTAVSYTSIATFIGLASPTDTSIKGLKETRLKELIRWMFEEDENGQTRIGESRNLKALNRIVASDSALKAFRTGYSISQSDRLTDAPKDGFQNSIRDSRKSLEAAKSQTHLFDNPDPADSDVLEDIGKMQRHLMEWVSGKLMRV